MKIKTFLTTGGVFFLFQVLINVAWGQMFRSQSVDLGKLLGMLIFSLPFGILGSFVLCWKKLGPTSMGLLSLAFGIVDEILGLISGEGSVGTIGLVSLNITQPVLFSLFSIITYWFAGWSIPTYVINEYIKKLDIKIHQSSLSLIWYKDGQIWIGIIAALSLALLSYLDYFS